MKLPIVLSLFVAAGVAADEPIGPPKFTPAGHTTDKLEVVRQRIRSKTAVLLDVREKEEWSAGHLKRAGFVPMSAVRSEMLTQKMKKALPKDKPIYVHCASGGRVLIVSEILRAKGYDIRPLKAGYTNLLKAGFEKAKPEEK